MGSKMLNSPENPEISPLITVPLVIHISYTFLDKVTDFFEPCQIFLHIKYVLQSS
jgi:hypothetical protein